jgi:hypothetical protein
MFLPVRYLPLGLAAAWAGRMVFRRFVDPPSEVRAAPAFGANRPPKNVTPEARQARIPARLVRGGREGAATPLPRTRDAPRPGRG